MRVFAISDIHIDYAENRQWFFDLSDCDYKEDILILAGDLTDDLELLGQCFERLSTKFSKVLFVPGNHELWISQDCSRHSIEKLEKINKIASNFSISLSPYHSNNLSVVPLFSWYDFSFAKPCNKLKDSWMDFKKCVWPGDIQPSDVNTYFLEKNKPHLDISNQTVISFSHFLPRIDLMPMYIPAAFQYIYPVLGSKDLEKQIRVLNPDIHVYGHSHVNQRVVYDETLYLNNAYGYPSEESIARKQLLCVYEC